MLRHPLPPISYISLILFSISSISAGAATFTVTNLSDSGPGSLRQAILDANAVLDADTIAFQPGLTGTITLTSAAIPITDRLTINGPGAGVLAITSNSTSIISTSIFFISSGFPVTLNNLTFRDNRSGGSAIYNGGTLTIDHCVLSNNSTTESGGAIDNLGTMTIANSILSGNSADYDGGAIFNRYTGTLTVNNSTLSGNSATAPRAGMNAGMGGAIYSQGGSLLTIANSTLSGNSATNNFANGNGGMGGAIAFGGKKLMIINSTLSGNSANSLPTCETTTYDCSGRGGALDAQGGNASDQMTVQDSTFTGNTATNQGGGIYLSYGTMSVGNSIVSGNQAPSARGKEAAASPPFYSPALLVSQGHNLFGENGSSGLVDASPVASDKILAGTIDTAIGPLADNGGPTRTHLPVAGSPALNAGDNALVPAGIATDQRGTGFARIVNNVVDIGAAEVQPPGSLVAGLTSTGQIYYTTVTALPAPDGGLLVGDDALPAPRANAWANLPGQLARLYVGDFNGDGEGDLAGIAGDGSIWYTTNRGPWTGVPGGLSQISVGDFTGAGRDGLAGLASDGSIWYTTTLTGWTQVPGRLSQLLTGDFNGDGRADLAGIAANGSIWYSTNLTTWNQVPGALAQLRVGDLNGDGKADLAGIASNGSVWYSTTLNGWNQAPGALAQLQVGDLNGDGQADLAGIASNGSVWYSTNLTGWTQLPGALSQLTASDLNGDGKADLVGLSSNGAIWYSTDLSGWVNLPGQLAQLAGR